MKILVVSRILSNDELTLSECYIRDEHTGIILLEFYGIELPWKNNQRRISCIPANDYVAAAVRRYSNNKYALWVQDVPGRSEIMVHQANYPRDVLGCLGPGRSILREIGIDSVYGAIIGVGPSAPVMKDIEKYVPLGEMIKYKVIDTFRRIGNLDPKESRKV